MKNMQPVQGSNRGPSTYRANALPTELTGLPTHNSPVPVHTQVTPATLLPPFLLRFDVECVESQSWNFRDVHVVQRAVTAPNRNRTDEKYAASPGLEPGTLRLQGERSPDWANRAAYTQFISTCTYPSHSRYKRKSGLLWLVVYPCLAFTLLFTMGIYGGNS